MQILKFWQKLLQNRKFTVSEFQLEVATVAYILVGVGIGVAIIISGLPASLQALQQVSITKTNDTQFGQATLVNTQITGTGTNASLQLSAPADAWYNVSWQYRKRITFSNGSNAENLTNFPVMVNLTNSNFDFAKARSAGQDIRFSDSNGTTLLSYEIEQWDNAGQKAVIWVKVPQIDASSNNDYIYMYYGNNAANDAQSASAVWSNGYAAVWHMNNTPVAGVAGMLDSSGNNRHGTFQGGMNSGNLVDAKIGKGFSFNGSTNYITVPITGLNFNTGYFQTWGIKTTNSYGAIWGAANCVFEIGVYDNYYNFYTGGCAAGSYETNYILPLGATSWNSFGFEGRTNGNIQYVNGAAVVPTYASGSASTAIFLDDASAGGTIYYLGAYNSSTELWTGSLDEVRISNVVRSPAWIAADYASMNNTYTTFGSESGQISPSGTWESDTGANVIDLGWNGGWGDGTPSSNAFTANLTNLTNGNAVTFQMRVAQTAGALTSASYLTLGTANSGTTFTRTANDLTTLGLSINDYRYAQIKLTLTSGDNVTSPVVSDFTINYTTDVTDPNQNASNIILRRQLGGDIITNGWTNQLNPSFSWTSATDADSAIRGYCLYLGTDSGGDPEISKGLLGNTVSSTTGTTCQFLTQFTSIDFADTNLRGNTWLTTSNSDYYFRIKAVDLAGNVTDSVTTYTFRFDNVLPTNPAFISLPAGFIASKDATFTWPISGPNAASDSNSGVVGIQYRIGTGGTWYGDLHNASQDTSDILTADGSYTTDATYDYPLLSEGTNVIYIRTWDQAGNVSIIYTTGSLKINTTAPSAPQNLIVDPGSSDTNSYAFDWDPPQNFVGLANTLRYCYTINILPSAQNCTFTTTADTFLSADAFANQPGVNTFFLVARDEAGNVNYGASASVQFSYTGSAPGIPTNIDVSDISIRADSNWRLVISWNQPTSVGAGISAYRIYRSTTSTNCNVDDAGFSQIGSTGGISFTDSGLTQQNYYYCVKACDVANNCSAYSATGTNFPTGRFTEPASLVSQPVVTRLTSRTATIAWTTDRVSDSKIAYGLQSGSYFDEEPARSDQVVDHTINLTNLRPGTTYFYIAKWLDEDGNLGTSEEKVFTTAPAPFISESYITGINLDRAVLRYTVTGASRVRVHYGQTTSFGGLIEINTSTQTGSYTNLFQNLLDGTKYYYKINPVDSDGFEYEGTVVDFTTLPRPRISDVSVQEIKGEAVPTIEVIWQTNTLTTSIIEYQPQGSTRWDQEANQDYVRGEHRLRITDLVPAQKYNVRVRGVDEYGNEAISDVQTFTTGMDSRPPRIFNLIVEGTIVSAGANNGDQPSAQIIVSWDTDEPSTSQVQFGEGTGNVYNQKTQEDKTMTFNHLVVISKLQPSQVYHLQVLSSDDAGNQGVSADIVTITPKSSQSAIDLVLRNLGEIFSFLR